MLPTFAADGGAADQATVRTPAGRVGRLCSRSAARRGTVPTSEFGGLAGL